MEATLYNAIRCSKLTRRHNCLYQLWKANIHKLLILETFLNIWCHSFYLCKVSSTLSVFLLETKLCQFPSLMPGALLQNTGMICMPYIQYIDTRCSYFTYLPLLTLKDCWSHKSVTPAFLMHRCSDKKLKHWHARRGSLSIITLRLWGATVWKR